MALQVVLAEGRGVKVEYMDPLPPLRPSRCGERVAVCCVLVGVGMCRRVGKQAVVWLVNSRGEGPFILVWCLRFTVLFSLSLPLCHRDQFSLDPAVQFGALALCNARCRLPRAARLAQNV